MDAACVDQIKSVSLYLRLKIGIMLEIVEVYFACIEFFVCCRISCCRNKFDLDALLLKLRDNILNDL